MSERLIGEWVIVFVNDWLNWGINKVENRSSMVFMFLLRRSMFLLYISNLLALSPTCLFETNLTALSLSDLHFFFVVSFRKEHVFSYLKAIYIPLTIYGERIICKRSFPSIYPWYLYKTGSEIDAHVRSKLCYLICWRHLI